MNIAADVADTDPLYDQYGDIVVDVLGSQRPVSQEMIWAAIQTIYDLSPSSFTLVAGIHQDNPTDTLHFDVKVKLWSSSYTLKFRGYWKGTFHCSHVDCVEGNDPPVQIASFV